MLDADPLADIRNVRRVRTVVLGGVPHDSKDARRARHAAVAKLVWRGLTFRRLRRAPTNGCLSSLSHSWCWRASPVRGPSAPPSDSFEALVQRYIDQRRDSGNLARAAIEARLAAQKELLREVRAIAPGRAVSRAADRSRDDRRPARRIDLRAGRSCGHGRRTPSCICSTARSPA